MGARSLIESAVEEWKSTDSYDPYGPVGGLDNSLEKSINVPLAYALAQAHTWRSKRQDVTGLINMGARYYDPLIGRFISPDPYGHAGSIDLYSYANGNPIGYYDPDGRFASPILEKTDANKLLDRIQIGLDVAGMLPGIGIAADMVNAGIHGLRGDWVQAGLSAASAVPIIGDAFAAGRMGVKIADKGVDAVKGLKNVDNAGRAGKQAKLRELASDKNVSSADRGWIQQEINSIERGNRKNIRVPPGKNLAHQRGYEAKKGYCYEYSELQDVVIHKIQHKHEGY